MRDLSWALAAAIVMLGCQPDIGDPCTTNAQCSLTGDRLCDPTSPGGYCTQFNCLPGKCPDEAACVGFYGKLSNACPNALPEQRFERSFCMKKCTSDDDCRTGDGYRCLPPPAAVNAVVLEVGEAATTSVCMVELRAPNMPNQSTPEPQVCFPPDASFSDGGAQTGDASSDGAPKDAASADGPRADAANNDASDGDSGRDSGVRDARVGQ
jgi:hypothetical protein